MTKTKVAIIGTAGVPARYGGFETLAHHLVDQLHNDYDLTVYCSSSYYHRDEQVKQFNGARLVYLPLNANGLQSIFYDIISIIHALRYADKLLILGVSGCILLPFIKLFTNKKIIVNIDGMEWRRQKWSYPVRKFLKLSEYCAVKFSDADITDNAAIQRYTAMHYKTLSHMIAYGADHCAAEAISPSNVSRYPFLSSPYAFKVCRIEPENNIHMVLEAFANFSAFPLVMVGNWSNSEYSRGLKKKYSSNSNLILLDPIYDQRELNILRSNCTVYIHGHSAGGTNPSLVEAMYLGLPVFAYDVNFNRATTEGKARYFHSESELLSMLQQVKPEEREALGREMKAIANRRYTWPAIAQRYRFVLNTAFEKRTITPRAASIPVQTALRLGVRHLQQSNVFEERKIAQA
ncbi:MAG: DUF1972 domain-containing protein [Bacteroidetes bacterium]|nr:DUF1972 domain-containing protein [Bacteroidota bacterium]